MRNDEVEDAVPQPKEGVELKFSNRSELTEVEANRKGLSRIL